MLEAEAVVVLVEGKDKKAVVSVVGRGVRGGHQQAAGEGRGRGGCQAAGE